MIGETSIAVVLRTVEFSETSLIVTMLSRDFGRLSALAKGARRPKGPFEGSLDLLSVCRVVVIRKPHTGLDLLTEAKLHRRFRAAEKSLERTYAGYYVAEMLRLLTDDHDPLPELYDLTIQTLTQIDGTGNVPMALLRFDTAALKLLGNAPGLDRCTHCGSSIQPESRLSFALDAGGLVCQTCRSRQQQVISLGRETVDILRGLFGLPLDVPQADPFASRHYGPIRTLINRYLQSLLGKSPRMMPYLPNQLETEFNGRGVK
ncbi:DNA repair protein RecO [Crateriforma conspicua]|uniref:DNA repair protein RecO n=1 Tax=Crateriforma conspicua TaxID=2527996 RepID=A0A5C5YD49_9PLAN|nr:DNA repair protein RecO [Crateriforma conspicua]TWT71242.1 DNA repair protein RecO [Crateriforma conspicua]